MFDRLLLFSRGDHSYCILLLNLLDLLDPQLVLLVGLAHHSLDVSGAVFGHYRMHPLQACEHDCHFFNVDISVISKSLVSLSSNT
jgi:hypothetical protein